MAEVHTPMVAVLASGNGSTMKAFVEATQDGLVDAEVGLVICNNKPHPENVRVYDVVKELNKKHGTDIRAVRISNATHKERPQGDGAISYEASETMANIISSGRYDLVALMGFMRKITGPLLEEYGSLAVHRSPYEARMLNTHPGPLPETRGLHGVHVSERVLELGMQASRHTVHVVTADYDAGSIVAEHEVPVLPHYRNDPELLFQAVQKIEKANLPLDIGNFLAEQAIWNAEQGS